jgi:hypothetical protein
MNCCFLFHFFHWALSYANTGYVSTYQLYCCGKISVDPPSISNWRQDTQGEQLTFIVTYNKIALSQDQNIYET